MSCIGLGLGFLHLHTVFSDTGIKEAPSEAAPQAAATPVKKLDNLFFIEEPQNISVTESKPIPCLVLKTLLLQDILTYIVSFSEGVATFIAKIGGDPIPSVKWMKGKWRQVTPGGRISIEHKGQDAKLEIREVTKSDSGLYRCVASNKHGEIESGAEMEVTKKEEAEGFGDIRTRLKK